MLRQSKLLFLFLILFLHLFVIPSSRFGSLNSEENQRHLVALSKGPEKIFMSWRLLQSDSPDVTFNVYRADDIEGPYELLSDGENHPYTNFVDETVDNGSTYYYLVKPVSDGGVEGEASNRVQSVADGDDSGLVLEVQYAATELSPVGPGVGDLNGDGLLDYVILDNNLYESDRDRKPILRAYLHDGTPYWSFDTRYRYRNEAPGIVLPYIVWDLDGDGKSEVIMRMGRVDDLQTFLTILEADISGIPAVIDSIPFPTALPGSTFQLRPHYISAAYLDGLYNLPSIITQVAVHQDERVTAFDLNDRLEMSQRWDYQSDLSSRTSGSGTHGIPVYDIDGDGKEEVFDGSTVLDDDGTVLWTLNSQIGQRVRHPDAVIPGEIDASNSGPEVWFVSEGSPQGAYLTDSRGNVLWEERNWRHGHDGWAVDLVPGNPGAELYGFDIRKPSHEPNRMRLFTSRGQLLFSQFNLSPDRYHHPVQWDGDDAIEILHNDAGIIFNFDGSISGYLPVLCRFYNLQMDVVGDFREEFLVLNPDYNWMRIYTNTDQIDRNRLSDLEDLTYREAASRVTSSYWRYYSP